MRKLILIAVGVFLVLPAALFAGSMALFLHSLSRVDDYPAFLSTLRHNGPTTYSKAQQDFADLISRSFPPGSSADQTISTISNGGFEIAVVRPDSMGFQPNTTGLIWNRRAGPCTEQYSIKVSEDGAGRVKDVSGQMRPICL
ncbi:hypothetical protein SAMN05216374_6043 [Tardiphaga sp. OK246]|jgi:hypothetical protein|uniref:hypothetical protein n=1 Tax=Tardiphaga sp. OK246 TaxID=1855307 RepID=UPI000B66AB6A|nr:hypothetical protein [Tardiphaga sp. OK246]SNT62082.1 hypothetical protein SAMN05216374_6043 [Tardiphaga sp. OK246]